MRETFILELSILFGPARAVRREDSAALAVEVGLGYVETPKHAVVYRQVFEDVADITAAGINTSGGACGCLQMESDKDGEPAWENE